MNRVKCSSRSKDGSNDSYIITVCNRGRNLIGNQMAKRTNRRKSNINWAFRRTKWPDVIPKLINSFVNGVNYDFFWIPVTQKWIFNLFKFAFNLIQTNLKSPEWETLDQFNLPRRRSKSIPTQIQTGECRFSIYTSYESKRKAFTNTSKNGNLLSFSSSILKVKAGYKSFKQWKNDKASLRELKHAKVSST